MDDTRDRLVVLGVLSIARLTAGSSTHAPWWYFPSLEVGAAQASLLPAQHSQLSPYIAQAQGGLEPVDAPSRGGLTQLHSLLLLWGRGRGGRKMWVESGRQKRE